jgi:hypothetical protein
MSFSGPRTRAYFAPAVVLSLATLLIFSPSAAVAQTLSIEQIEKLPVGRHYRDILAITPPVIPKVEIDLRGGAEWVNLPMRAFLGFEINNIQRFGLFTPDRDITGSTFSGSIKLDTTELISPVYLFDNKVYGKTWVKYDMHYAGGLTINQRIDTIDPGPGASLLIPGEQGGNTGFRLTGNPANIVRNAVYDLDYYTFAGNTSIGQTKYYPGDLEHDFWFGLGHERKWLYENFMGQIPGFNRNFGYYSDAHVSTWKPRVGGGLRKEFIISDTVKFLLGGYGEIGADISHADATSRLAFTGFQDSVSSPSASETDLGFKVGLTAGWKTSNGISMNLNLDYRRDNALPVFERDGNNPTLIRLENGTVIDLTASLTIPFYGDERPNWIKSDRRLKRDIALLARRPDGIGIYRYRYLWSDVDYVGVMAQEVESIVPDAVSRAPDGFLRVNYSRLGMTMMTWQAWQAVLARQASQSRQASVAR